MNTIHTATALALSLLGILGATGCSRQATVQHPQSASFEAIDPADLLDLRADANGQVGAPGECEMSFAPSTVARTTNAAATLAFRPDSASAAAVKTEHIHAAR